jgi:hypothetical protein
MNSDDRDDPLLRRAREAFEGAVDGVDPSTANRLRLARRAALAAPASPRGWLLPLAGAAAMGVLAWLAWPRAQVPTALPAPVATMPVAPAPAVVVAPGEPVVEEPAVDLLIEDVPVDDDTDWAALDDDDAEVYEWLADAPVAPDTGEDAL